MKVYIVCEYYKHVDKVQGISSLKLSKIEAVTTSRKLAEMIADALQYRKDRNKEFWIYGVEEFEVYGRC